MNSRLFIDLPSEIGKNYIELELLSGIQMQLVYFKNDIPYSIRNLVNAYELIDQYQISDRLKEGSELYDINELIVGKNWEFISKICLVKAIDSFLHRRGFKGKLVKIISISIDERYNYPLAELKEYALALLK
jgi:hypothetical protein